MLVDCTNQTTVFPPGPSLHDGLKPVCRQMYFLSAPLPDLGPFPSSPPPGLVPYNLIQQTFTEHSYQRGVVLTLEIQRETGSPAQGTPGLPAHSYL